MDDGRSGPRPSPPGGRVPDPEPHPPPEPPEGSDLRPAVFLDRDGTLVVEREYLDDPEEAELVPGAAAALRDLRDAGFVLVVTTNQSGIARGYYSEADYRAVAARIEELLEEAGALVDATYFCPHHPEHGEPCGCRKPGVRMHLEAARTLGLAPERSWFVGDKVKDVLPARTLGGRGILVRTGFGREEEPRLPQGFRVARDLAHAARMIRESAGAPP